MARSILTEWPDTDGEETMTNQWKRRRFLSTAGRAAAGLVILRDSRSVWGYPANEKLNIAVVGVGGMGAWNLTHMAGENVEYGSGMRVKPSSQSGDERREHRGSLRH